MPGHAATAPPRRRKNLPGDVVSQQGPEPKLPAEPHVTQRQKEKKKKLHLALLQCHVDLLACDCPSSDMPDACTAAVLATWTACHVSSKKQRDIVNVVKMRHENSAFKFFDHVLTMDRYTDCYSMEKNHRQCVSYRQDILSCT